MPGIARRKRRSYSLVLERRQVSDFLGQKSETSLIDAARPFPPSWGGSRARVLGT